jgi:glycosyltransferase involved in cell wall biosynthesis
MDPLRVLHVSCYSERAWAFGGIPRVLAAQTRGLAERGVRVTVATTDAYGEERLPAGEQTAARPGVEVAVFRNLSNTLARRLQLYLPLGMRTFLRHRAATFDIAHVHGFRNLPGTWAASILSRAGVAVVLQPNGTAPRIERRRLAKAVFDAVAGRTTLADASVVIAVSAAEERQLEAMGVEPERIARVPNPVDLTEFEGLPEAGGLRRRLGLGDGPLVLYLGQLSPRKRVDLAVHAMATLDDGDAHLVIAGPDMGSEAALRRLAAGLGLADRCHFIGVLAGADRLGALADADVVVYPSEHEIFGLVPLEALLCGTPVVVADDCGCGEVIARTGGGEVVEHGNPDALAVAVAAILDAPARWREPVDRAARRIAELYSTEAVAAQLEALYRRLRTAPPGAPP